MPDQPFTLPMAFDYAGTFVYALAGTLQALRKGYDIVGILTVAFVCAVGGGLIRDGLFLQQGPPFFAADAWYYVFILAGAGFGIGLQHWLFHMHRPIALFDALGLGMYAVVGMQKAFLAGLAVPTIIVIGIINAVGGGILRDVLTREEPLIFRPGQFYVAAVFAGTLVFIGLKLFTVVGSPWTGLITIAVTFALRTLTIYKNWQTRALTLQPARHPVAVSEEAATE